MEDQVEIWKALPGVTGVEVSTLDNIRTLNRIVSSETGTRFLKGRVLKQRNDKDGYLLVHIKIDGKQTTKLAHRLVAQTFIKNADNLPQVNHLDCNRTNNNVENLEWCTASYNQKYREKYGVSQTEAVGHPVFAINLSTLEVTHFQSQSEAGQALGADTGSINKVIKGRLKQTNGFWFVNDDGKADDAINRKLHDIGGNLK